MTKHFSYAGDRDIFGDSPVLINIFGQIIQSLCHLDSAILHHFHSLNS